MVWGHLWVLSRAGLELQSTEHKSLAESHLHLHRSATVLLALRSPWPLTVLCEALGLSELKTPLVHAFVPLIGF